MTPTITKAIQSIMALNPAADDEFILTNMGDDEKGEFLWWAGLGGEGNPVVLGEMGPGQATYNGYGATPGDALFDLWVKLVEAT